MTVSRRTLVKGSAWTVPAIAIATAAPVMALSPGAGKLHSAGSLAIYHDELWSTQEGCRNPIPAVVALGAPSLDYLENGQLVDTASGPYLEQVAADPDSNYTRVPWAIEYPASIPFIEGVSSDDITITRAEFTFGYGLYQVDAAGHYMPMTNRDGSVENPLQSWTAGEHGNRGWSVPQSSGLFTAKRSDYAATGSTVWPTGAGDIAFPIYTTVLDARRTKNYQVDGT